MSTAVSNRPIKQPIELDWLDMIQLWKRGAATIVVAALLGGAGFYGISYAVTPSYDSTTVLLLDRPDASKLANTTDAFQIDAAQRATLVHSNLEILRSADIIERVIRDLDLANAPMFNQPPGLFERISLSASALIKKYIGVKEESPGDEALVRETRLIQDYLQRLSVVQDTDTYIIRLTFTAPDPVLAARILNAHTAAYLNWLQLQRRTAVAGAYDWLEQAVPNAEARVQAAQSAVESFRDKTHLVDVDGRTSLDQSLSQMSQDLATARTAMLQGRARAEQIRSLQAAGEIAAIAAMSDSKSLSDLQTSAAQASSDLARLQSTEGSNNPELRASKAYLAELKARINGEIDDLVKKEISTATIAETTVKNLTAALADIKDSKLQAENSRAELLRLQGTVEAEQTVYLSLLTKLRSFDRIGELQKSQATLLSPALIPDKPSSPRRTLFMLFGTFLSAGIAAILIVWRAGRRGLVRHTADVSLSSGIPQIAVMPEFAINARLGGFDRTQPKYAFFLQELRALYAQLLRNAGRPGRGLSVVVTSSLPDEGKSSFCGEFALFAAQSGLRTLLATTDPKNRLAGVATPTEPLQLERSIALFRASLPITASLSARGEAAERLAKWQNEYDLVVIDTPPVSGMADSVVLASSVDTMLVLARIDRTPCALLSAVVDQLESVGGNVAGTVVTFAKLDRKQGVLPSDFSYYFGSNRAYYKKLLSIEPLEVSGTN